MLRRKKPQGQPQRGYHRYQVTVDGKAEIVYAPNEITAVGATKRKVKKGSKIKVKKKGWLW